MSQITINFNLQLNQEKLKSFNFMIKFYSIHAELDIDQELSLLLEKESKKSFNMIFSWKGNSKSEDVVEILVNRLNFFINSGKITAFQKNKIQEIDLENGSYQIKHFNSFNPEKIFKQDSVSWSLGNYFVLKYHLLLILIQKLSKSNKLDLNALAAECFIDKRFLINFIYSFINKTLIEYVSNNEIAQITITSDVEQKVNDLRNLLAEMEFNLAS